MSNEVRIVKLKQHGKDQGKLISIALPLNEKVININGVDFRVIPEYPNAGISTDGIIINIVKKRIYKQHVSNGYLRVCIYNKNGIKVMCRTHRLVALAWLTNTDYSKNTIVQFINGDKTNVSTTNLKWTTHGDNIIRALHGKATNNYIVYELTTRTVHKVASTNEAGLLIGTRIKTAYLNRIIRKGGKAYVVLRSDDEVNFKKWQRTPAYRYQVFKNGKLVAEVNKLKELSNYGKVGLATSHRHSFTQTKICIAKLGYTIKRYHKPAAFKLYCIKDIKSNEEYLNQTLTEAANIIGVSDVCVLSRSPNGASYGVLIKSITGEWLVRAANENQYPDITKPKHVRNIPCILIKGNTKLEFLSITAAARYLRVSFTAVKRCIATTDATIKGYKIVHQA